MSGFKNSLSHCEVPTIWRVLLNQGFVHLIRIVQVHVEQSCSQLWRPPVLVAFKSNIVLGFVLVAFINEVEGLGVLPVMLRARHRSLRSLSHIVDLEIPPQAILNNGCRMEVRKGSDNVIVQPHRIAKRLGVVLKELSFICALFH